MTNPAEDSGRLLGIDLGTGSVKALLISAEGRTTFEAAVPYPPSPEMDVAIWWAATVAAVRRVREHDPGPVRAVGLSGQMHGVVLLDASGRALGPAITWTDRRATPLLDGFASRAAELLVDLANPLTPGMAGPILFRLAGEQPARLARAHRAAQPKDWLGSLLTGEIVTDPSDASATLLWDVATDGWHLELCERLGLDHGLLAPVRPSSAVRGTLMAGPADELGLEAGTPVAVGAADTAAALLGTGAVHWQMAQVTTGTGGQVVVVLDEPVVDATGRTHLYRDARLRGWYAMGAVENVGLALEWVRGLFGSSWEEMYDTAFGAPPGSDGVTFLPYLRGERTPHLDPALTGGWSGLRSHHGRPEILRSAFEGVALALRDAWDALRACGHDAESLRLAGGGSTDPRWRRLLADVLDRPIDVPASGAASARGAALLAGVACGMFGDVEQAAATVEAPRRVADPSGAAAVYAEVLARFRAASGSSRSAPGPPSGGGTGPPVNPAGS